MRTAIAPAPIILEFRANYMVPEAKGFYDPHEELFELRIKEVGELAVILQGRHISIDVDENGKLAYLEVTLPRGLWESDYNLQPPDEYCRAEAYFQTLPLNLLRPRLLSNPEQSFLCIEFSKAFPWRSVEVARSVIVDIDSSYRLLRIWITGIEVDFTFRKRLAWSQSKALSF